MAMIMASQAICSGSNPGIRIIIVFPTIKINRQMLYNFLKVKMIFLYAGLTLIIIGLFLMFFITFQKQQKPNAVFYVKEKKNIHQPEIKKELKDEKEEIDIQEIKQHILDISSDR